VVFPLFLGLVAWQPQTARVITRCMKLSNGYPALHPPRPGTNQSWVRGARAQRAAL